MFCILHMLLLYILDILYIYIYILYTSVLLSIPSTRCTVEKQCGCNRELFCYFNCCILATESCFVTSTVVQLQVFEVAAFLQQGAALLLQLLFRCQGFKLPSGVEKQHQKLQVEPKRGPGGSKLTLKCSQQLQSGAQELPSGAQELPSGTQELQNGAQEQPSSAQEPPSWVQEAPKRLQVESKRRPRGHKLSPRRAQEAQKAVLKGKSAKT